MPHKKDDLIQDILVDSELAKILVPNKFKHTSKQGRVRRQKLLMSAQKLSEFRDIGDISLADVCEDAGIPRASAYHFFPNVESIFLALRFLNFIETLHILEKISVSDFNQWDGYIEKIIRESAVTFNKDLTKNKLMYGCNTPDFDSVDYEQKVDVSMVNMITDRLTSHYDASNYPELHSKVFIAYSLAHSVFSLSYRQHGVITSEMIDEAVTACISYLRTYLPQKLPKNK
ncbi:TetR/AcrR family transcriptional regulator [Psychrobacter sp. FDAARGOS_221]|uniref:TetR/AcrR family transcriptional regulator n=1 Tax=Psychrobacter sp. FDAARGOS_221 TaxID=1975705 RepID=UPI000BB59B6C|nr:TetR/AcrR family transcriptional regulator [Psychrobacter sp. FDAARGOS_221]PNK60006.1 TetR/AcrR family transcriptional regulator [Psychrobacter sp. FDAARGOS_221]